MPTLKPRLLRSGHATQDRRLDAIPEWDDRNLSRFPAAALLEAPAKPVKGRTWRAGPVLDQGREGACVGFSLATELAGDPVRGGKSYDDQAELAKIARKLYKRAQDLDEWPETGPGGTAEGTSILAGAKAAVEAGLFGEYRWAETVDELVRILTTGSSEDLFGPTIAGVAWHEGMYATAPDGLVEVSGVLVGRHAIAIRGVLLSDKRGQGDPLFRWRNTWGPTYGLEGDGLIRAADLERILGRRPELMVPVTRKRPPQEV